MLNILTKYVSEVILSTSPDLHIKMIGESVFGVGSPLKGYTKDIFIRGSENCTQDETGRSDRAAKNTGLPGRPANA